MNSNNRVKLCVENPTGTTPINSSNSRAAAQRRSAEALNDGPDGRKDERGSRRGGAKSEVERLCRNIRSQDMESYVYNYNVLPRRVAKYQVYSNGFDMTDCGFSLPIPRQTANTI